MNQILRIRQHRHALLEPLPVLRLPRLAHLRVPRRALLADEPVRGLHVRERREAERDGERRAGVWPRERGEGEEGLGVERRGPHGEVREEDGGEDEERELRDGGDEHCGERCAGVFAEELDSAFCDLF